MHVALSMMLSTRRYLQANGRIVVIRGLSLSANLPKSSVDVEEKLASQPFVKTRLEPGEWDPEHTNPLYRPKFRSSAKIISSDDFANRPEVGISEEFETFQDAMITLSWLDQNDHKLVYQLYLDLMVSAEASSGGRTSHEYVMRVVAQKFNITADRVAAIVQLQHNEQQMILENPDIELCTELADEMDREFKAEIDEAYETFNLKKPEAFVEDPVGVAGLKEKKIWVIADDVFDVDQMTQDAIIREERDARLIIDGHVYIEDVDKESISVPMDKDCRSLVKQRTAIDKKMTEDSARVLSERAKKKAIEPAWRTTNGEGETRVRYKFIAQTVNTRQLKKARAKHRSYTNNNVANTLVEHNGELRAGNMSDIESVSWKGIRNNHEHMYSGAKQGWLDRINRNATKSWGRAPVRVPRLHKPVAIPPAEIDTAVVASLDDIDAVVGGTGEEVGDKVVALSENVASTNYVEEVHTKNAVVPIAAAEEETSSEQSLPAVVGSPTLDVNALEESKGSTPSEIITAEDSVVASDAGTTTREGSTPVSDKEMTGSVPAAKVEIKIETYVAEAVIISVSSENENVIGMAAQSQSTSVQEDSKNVSDVVVSDAADVVVTSLSDVQHLPPIDEELVSEMNVIETSLMQSPPLENSIDSQLHDITANVEIDQESLETSKTNKDAAVLSGTDEAKIESAVSADETSDSKHTDQVDKPEKP